MPAAILILPGLFNSGDGHWQTVWEAVLPHARRVQQQDWNAPKCQDWVSCLDASIAAAEGPVLLAAHSLGCALTAWWAATCATQAHVGKVKGALLVAPPDVERPEFPPFAQGFSPMPRQPLPFKTIVAASSDDPWCALPKAQAWAASWGAQFHNIGARGHINADSGLGGWPEGRHWLDELASS